MKRVRLALALFVAITVAVFLGISLLPQQSPGGLLTAPAPSMQTLQFNSADRVLILSPHPDDEVLGTGGIVQQALAMHLPLHICFLTNGDANEWSFMVYQHRPMLGTSAVESMGMVRHDEAVRADTVLGLAPTDLTFLGYPDNGTLSIWTDHWGAARPPLRSIFSRVTRVPYPNALRPGAPYRGEEIVADLTTVIRDFKPSVVFMSHPGDLNVDHRALYLYAHVALWNLAQQGLAMPSIHPFLVHARRWPLPEGYHPDDDLEPPARLRNLQWTTAPLDDAQIARKNQALLEHRTQTSYSKKYLQSFVRKNELFNDFPAVFSAGAETTPRGTLIDAAPASMVGTEWRFVRRNGDKLQVSLDFARPLGGQVGASFYLFGWRADKPFEAMPKVQIKLGGFGKSVTDQGRRLPATSIAEERHGRELTVTVPLALLGNPRRVFMSATAWIGQARLDQTVWYIVETP